MHTHTHKLHTDTCTHRTHTQHTTRNNTHRAHSRSPRVQYDDDGSGELDFDEFLVAVRNDCGIPVTEVSDRAIKALFKSVDVDR